MSREVEHEHRWGGVQASFGREGAFFHRRCSCGAMESITSEQFFAHFNLVRS